MKKIVVLGAGGKMGYRCSSNLRGAPYEVMHVEVSEAGRERLKALGITCLSAQDALPQAEIKDITRATTPFDFEGRLDRLCYLIKPSS